MRKLRDVLDRARGSVTASQGQYTATFDNKVRYRLLIAVGDYVYVDRPPRTLRRVRRGSADFAADEGGPDVKLLPRTECPFGIRSATDVTVVIDQDGVSNRLSIDRVTKMPLGPIGTAATTVPPDRRGETPDPTAKYVVERVAAHRETPSSMHYNVRWQV